MGVAFLSNLRRDTDLGISACHRAAWTVPRRAAVEMFPRVCPGARTRARRPNPSTQT